MYWNKESQAGLLNWKIMKKLPVCNDHGSLPPGESTCLTLCCSTKRQLAVRAVLAQQCWEATEFHALSQTAQLQNMYERKSLVVADLKGERPQILDRHIYTSSVTKCVSCSITVKGLICLFVPNCS